MKCKYHKEKFIPKYPFQKFCLLDYECIKAFNEFVKAEKEKQKLSKTKHLKKQSKNMITKRNVQHLKKTLKHKFTYIRNRDKGKPCISCTTME